MYRITLACGGIDPSVGNSAAIDIEGEFRNDRQWHQDVTCRFNGDELVLVATNDFDEKGFALQDEFSDCLSAYLTEHGGDLRIVSVETV